MAELAARSGGGIGSLHLDEGFGPLDPNALDEAIEALQNRAKTGQMIMVISHVPAVAENIERVLQVSPSPAGSSAEWLGEAERDALLLTAAAADAA
jgi:exonuclease SbcC